MASDKPDSIVSTGLHAATSGHEAPSLVLLHGFGGLAASWDAVRARLATNRQIIAYDLPGHGGSLRYAGAGPVKLAVRAIIDDLTVRGVERFHLAGHSMGGAISMLIALAAPERVLSLTLAAPGGMGPDIAAETLRRFAEATAPGDIRASLAEMSAPGFAINDALIDTVAASRRGEGRTEMLRTIAAAITRDGRQGVIPREPLAALPMPVTLIWGDSDSVLPFSQTADRPANFRLVEAPGAGHMLLDERPELVASELLRQLGPD